MNQNLFDILISKGESDTLDFKISGYFSDSATSKKDKDSDFIKDILSFTNTVRNESAYIIIGVNDNGDKVGISDNDYTDKCNITI